MSVAKRSASHVHDHRDPLGWDAERRARFWAFVAARGSDECWPWTGSCMKAGAPRYRYRCCGRQMSVYAQRAAYILTHGPLAAHEEAAHSCPMRRCVNLAHVVVGRAAVRAKLTVAKGRSNHGERHPMAKLSRTQVRAILGEKVMKRRRTAAEVALSYGMASASSVASIWRGTAWTRVWRSPRQRRPLRKGPRRQE